MKLIVASSAELGKSLEQFVEDEEKEGVNITTVEWAAWADDVAVDRAHRSSQIHRRRPNFRANPFASSTRPLLTSLDIKVGK
jgi:hypothetical protein